MNKNTVVPNLPAGSDNGSEPGNWFGWQSGNDLVRKRLSRPGWLINDLWIDGAYGIIGGAPKVGKTWWAMEMAMSVATGTKVAGLFEVPRPGKVLYIAEEGREATIRDRQLKLMHAKGLSEGALHNIKFAIQRHVRLDEHRWQERLLNEVAAERPSLVVLDPLVRMHCCNENDAQEMFPVLTFLRRLSVEAKTSLMVVHHFRKPPIGKADNGPDALRGNGDFRAWYECALFLAQLQDKSVQLSLEHRDVEDSTKYELGRGVTEDDQGVRFTCQQVINDPLRVAMVRHVDFLREHAKDGVTGEMFEKNIPMRRSDRLQVFKALTDRIIKKTERRPCKDGKNHNVVVFYPREDVS